MCMSSTAAIRNSALVSKWHTVFFYVLARCFDVSEERTTFFFRVNGLVHVDAAVTRSERKKNPRQLYRVYLNWSDTWGVPPTNTRKQFSRYFLQLHPLEFFLWGHLKILLVSSAAIENEETLHRRISDDCTTIRSRSGTSERVRPSMIRSVHACDD